MKRGCMQIQSQPTVVLEKNLGDHLVQLLTLLKSKAHCKLLASDVGGVCRKHPGHFSSIYSALRKVLDTVPVPGGELWRT